MRRQRAPVGQQEHVISTEACVARTPVCVQRFYTVIPPPWGGGVRIRHKTEVHAKFW
jgi:hypothetical protein